MGMSVGGSTHGVSSEPNVVPMIDILLVLLIIFMMSQPLERRALDVQVPPLDNATATLASAQIVFEIRSDGSYAVNQMPIPEDQIVNQLIQMYKDRAKLIFIKGADNRTWQEWIKAAQYARQAGIDGIGFTPRGS